MNAEMLVVPHPYYTVTDESGRFQLTDVPPIDARASHGALALQQTSN